MGRSRQLAALAAGAFLYLQAAAVPPEHANDNLTEIRVLSSRADLISGGNALVEIILSRKAPPATVRVDLNGVDVTSAFALRTDGRFYGLVTGLREGDNALTARVPNGPGARITITNHAIGGPIISGEQLEPWQCQTETTNPATNLGPAVDAQCNAPTKYRFVYRNAANTQFLAYDPANPPPPEAIRNVSANGITLPYIVRVERGTMNRGIHEIAVLFDPSKAWTPWARQAQWNGKLVMQYGAGTSQQYRQGTPDNVLNNEALGLGFAVASSSMLVNGQHANYVTAAETTIMLKEHFIEGYGEIRYTIGQGDSGGALLQHLIADNYPGVLDGLRPTNDWEDSISGAYREFVDSTLLLRVFSTSALSYSDDERRAVGGWGNNNIYIIENGRMADYNRPDDGTNCAGADSYDPTSNPLGVRCTFQDFMASILGKRPQDGHANLVVDNVGVQYGLAALKSGALSVEKFVDVNARVGGFDVDGRWQSQRSAIEPHVAELLHRTGQVTYGANLGKVPEIALRGTNNGDYHYPFRTVVQRARLTAANGHADNHVYWIQRPASVSTLAAMDRWLAAIEADMAEGTQAEKVVRNKPADVVSACWISGVMVTDLAACDAQFPYFREPRTVAGDAPTIYTMKCQLKPLDRADYGGAVFTDAQWAALQAAFANGVCDFSRPGVGFQAPVPWLTYAAGPGGQPLGKAPASLPGDGGN